jgi:glycosyltransferase involved in cell wall biosynthesis
MKIVNWQVSMSNQQFYMWKAVKAFLDEEFILIINDLQDVNPHKSITANSLNTLGEVVLLEESNLKMCLDFLNRYRDAVHVFNGFRNAWYFFPLILYGIVHNVKVAVMNEPYSISPFGYTSEEGIWRARSKVMVRPFLYRLMALLLNAFIRQVQPCILPISLIAFEQLEKVGFDPKIMYPFGYFEPKSSSCSVRYDRQPESFNLIYVGLLIKRKGLDIAIQTVESLHSRGFSISLDIYGPGQPERFIAAESNCVHYKGLIPQSDVQATISKYDMLILPSRHDGWGTVVNEALLQGVPVVVSDRVGAKCLVENSGAGIVFVSEDSADLAHKLEELILEPLRLDGMRHRASEVGQAISPEAGAQYLMDVFQYHFYHHGQRPIALWSSMK